MTLTGTLLKSGRFGIPRIESPTLSRFLARVHIPFGLESCWGFYAADKGKGYPACWHNGRVDRAHRVSYELFVGPITDGLWVLHKCDNPACIRPSHLYLGTCQDNVDDKMKRGRFVKMVGEKHGMARITEAQAVKVFELRKIGLSCQKIADQFGVAESLIRFVCSGRTWKHLGLANSLPRFSYRGERVASAKLNEVAVIEIRKSYSSGVASSVLSAKFGVSKTTITRIASGKMWAHVGVGE